jgi:hypothetical protein
VNGRPPKIAVEQTVGSRAPAAADGEQCVLETVALGGQHFEHLATTGQQSVKSIGRLIGQRPGVGTHALRKERQGIGIDPIGFGELAGRPATHPGAFDDARHQGVSLSGAFWSVDFLA